MGKHNPGVQLRLGSSLVEKDLEVLVGSSSMNHSSTLFTHSNPTGCWTAPRRALQQTQRSHCPTLLSAYQTTPGVMCSVLVSAILKRWQAGEGPEKGHKDDQWCGKTALWEKAERSGFSQSWKKRRLRVDLIIMFIQYLKGGCKEGGDSLFCSKSYRKERG